MTECQPAHHRCCHARYERRELAQALRKTTESQILFMSGYTADDCPSRCADEVHFVGKPLACDMHRGWRQAVLQVITTADA